MNALHRLPDSPMARTLPPAFKGVFQKPGEVDPSDSTLADFGYGARGPSSISFKRLWCAWVQPQPALGAAPAEGTQAYPGSDWGIRAAEDDETAPCWDEVVVFLRIGAHEADA